jgi:PX domain
MALTSADLVTAPVGADAQAQPFSDDMQDVPLQNSIAASPPKDASAFNSPRSPPDDTPQASTSQPTQFPAPRKQQALVATVHSPESVSEHSFGVLSTSHTVFSVETMSTLKSFPRAHCCVKRRFSDFAVLHEALNHRFAGYFIPPCPSKDLLQGKLVAGKQFLHKRAQDLEVFVSRCCDHEELQSAAVRCRLPASCMRAYMQVQHTQQRRVTAHTPGTSALNAAQHTCPRCPGKAAMPAQHCLVLCSC